MKHKPKELVLLGAGIRRVRQSMGISQEALSALCGLHRTYVGSVERGERNIGFLNLVKIARALKKRPAELLEGLK